MILNKKSGCCWEDWESWEDSFNKKVYTWSRINKH